MRRMAGKLVMPNVLTGSRAGLVNLHELHRVSRDALALSRTPPGLSLAQR
jgi:hypothetical protein